jgi:hypothetical protein
VPSLGSRAMAWMCVMATGFALALGGAATELGGVMVVGAAVWPAGVEEPAGVAVAPHAVRVVLAARAAAARSSRLPRGVLMRRS